MYSLIEISQRYGLPTLINPIIEITLSEVIPILKICHREYWTKNHKCDAAGCGTCMVLDGGMKPHRKVCAAKMSGIKIFENSGVQTVTGCTKIPGPRSKFCKEHVKEETPCILGNMVQRSTRETLKEFRKKHSKDKKALPDNVFTIELILDIKIDNGKKCYLVKWQEFPEAMATWEQESTIPTFIRLYYEKNENLGKKLPNPKIKRSKKAGKDTIYHFLTWEGETGGTWLNDNIFLEDDVNNLQDVEKSCNTRKDVDKVTIFDIFITIFLISIYFQRSRRHTCGILIGSFPCGVVPLIDELFGSESTSQGYGILIEYMSRLSDEALSRMDRFLYDDMCHLKPFSEKKSMMDQNAITKQFGESSKAVDKFHFPGHVSKKCHETCDPYKMKCFDDINSPVCEQVFSRLNKFTQVKGMNESHFLFFFIYLLDLQNLSIEGRLRSVANPMSSERKSIVQKSYGKENNFSEDIVIALSNSITSMDISKIEEEVAKVDIHHVKPYKCNKCDAEYKLEGFLKKHSQQKHNRSLELHHSCNVCDTKFEMKKQLTRHMKAHKDCEPKTNLLCDKCNKQYKIQKYFQNHVLSC